jgi:hypothetical protein
LQKNPADRYPSAAAVGEELARIRGKASCLISPHRLLEIASAVFPAPLAGLALAVEREDHLLAQRDKLLNQAGGFINYLGFLAAAARDGVLPGEFARPSLGHWVGLVRQGLRSPEPAWPLAEIRAQLADVGDFLQGLDELVQLRNELAHAAAPEEGPALHSWVQRMSASARRVSRSLLFLARYSLVAVEDMDYRDGRFLLSLRRLDGAGPAPPLITAALPEPYTRGQVYFATGDFARMRSLHPWVVLARCPLCSQRELFFYVAARRGELVYVTPDRGHSWSCPTPAGWEKVVDGV